MISRGPHQPQPLRDLGWPLRGGVFWLAVVSEQQPTNCPCAVPLIRVSFKNIPTAGPNTFASRSWAVPALLIEDTKLKGGDRLSVPLPALRRNGAGTCVSMGAGTVQ